MCPPFPAGQGRALPHSSRFLPCCSAWLWELPRPRPSACSASTREWLVHLRRLQAKQERGQQQISPSDTQKPPYCRKWLYCHCTIWSRQEMQLFCPHQLLKGEICCPLKGKTFSFLLGLGGRDGERKLSPPQHLWDL